jgi:hypothetical protein
MNRQELCAGWAVYGLAATTLAANLLGCASKGPKVAVADLQPAPLGTISDSIWQQQEEHAEASDFVIHEHEWVGNSSKLNAAGMEHVKQIAVRAPSNSFPVLVERSSMSVDPQSQHKFPVNGHEELDWERRQLVTQALSEMGVPDADNRVVVSPALAPGFTEFEGERAYNTGFSSNQSNGFGFGSGFGSGFGGGFGGGFF